MKQPRTIDEAVIEVIVYQESRRTLDRNKNSKDKFRSGKAVNMVRPKDDHDDEDDDEPDEYTGGSNEYETGECVLSRVPTKGPDRIKFMPKYGTKSEVNSDLSQILKRFDQQEKKLEGQIEKLQKDIKDIAPQFEKQLAETKKIEERVTVLEETVGNLKVNKQPNRQRFIANGQRGPPNSDSRPRNYRCFGCGTVGHYFNDCPTARGTVNSAQTLIGKNDQVPTMGNGTQVTYTMNPVGFGQMPGQVMGPVSEDQRTN